MRTAPVAKKACYSTARQTMVTDSAIPVVAWPPFVRQRWKGILTDTEKWLNANGPIKFYQFSINYDNLDYFVRSEVTQFKGEKGLVSDIESFYISAGYNFYPYTVYVSYSKKNLHFDHPDNEIPVGISPDLDILAATYIAFTEAFADDKSVGIKIGTRWDWSPNLALKAEVTFVEATEEISNEYAVKDLGGFDGRAVLYQLGIEWVF